MTSPSRTGSSSRHSSQQRNAAPTQRVYPSIRVPSTFQTAPSAAPSSSRAPFAGGFSSQQAGYLQQANHGQGYSGYSEFQSSAASPAGLFQQGPLSLRLSDSSKDDILEQANRGSQRSRAATSTAGSSGYGSQQAGYSQPVNHRQGFSGYSEFHSSAPSQAELFQQAVPLLRVSNSQQGDSSGCPMGSQDRTGASSSSGQAAPGGPSIQQASGSHRVLDSNPPSQAGAQTSAAFLDGFASRRDSNVASASGLPPGRSSRSRSSKTSQYPYVRRRGKYFVAEYRLPKNREIRFWVGTFDKELDAYVAARTHRENMLRQLDEEAKSSESESTHEVSIENRPSKRPK